jgi:hypothetical protein
MVGEQAALSVADARQHRLEGDAGQLQRCACADYRLAGDVALAATLVSAGVAAILTSTSLTGF